MSTTITEDPNPVPERAVAPAADGSLVLWLALLAGLSIVVGLLAGVFWAAVVTLPTWRIDPETSLAVMSERAVTELVAADVWFVITGALVGVGLGLVTWKWFRPLGWPTALLAVGAGLLAGVVCWQLGQLFGPGPEAVRISEAAPGAVVRSSLQLRSLSALAVWAFAAITPVLLISSLGPDEEDPATRRPRTGPGEPGPEPETGTVDERGVLTGSDKPSA